MTDYLREAGKRAPLPPSTPSAQAAQAHCARSPQPRGVRGAAADGGAARALGDFIRTHRERLTPELLGLPPSARRRTPGLRREEVAQLCAVSPTWYTWIEQGRPVSASADALARIAVALRLSRAERAYLFELAAQRDPTEPDALAADAPVALLDSVALLATPAYVLDRHWDAIGWNDAASELMGGWLDGAHDRNLLRFTFTVPAAQLLIVDWTTRARRLAAEFRADSIRHLHEPATQALIGELIGASPAFAHFWASQDVVEREGGTREFNHPLRGPLIYEQITLRPAHREDLKLVALIAR